VEALGHSLTWNTTCFIGDGCGAKVFGHTNGYGDFVLFDELMPPWPVHDCDLRRFELSSRSKALEIQHTREFPVLLTGVARLPESFEPLEAIAARRAQSFSVVATVVDVFETLAEWRKELRKERVFGDRSVLMYNQAQSSRSVRRLFSGESKEQYAFVDLNEFRVRCKDVVAAILQRTRLLDEDVLVVVDCKRFRTK
jgi:hypothetical protein